MLDLQPSLVEYIAYIRKVKTSMKNILWSISLNVGVLNIREFKNISK